MNVYRFEMKRIFGSMLTWSISIVGVLLLFTKGMYPILLETRPAVEAIFSNFPPEMLTAFSLDVESFFSYEGFLVFTNLYTGILAVFLAVYLALQIFAREKRNQCTDFLLTKPMQRSSLFLAKYAAGLTALSFYNLLYTIVVLFDYNVQNHSASAELNLSYFLLSSLLTQLLFFTFATVYAIFSKRVRSVVTTATAFSLGAFMLSVLVALLEKDFLRFIAPLDYFNTRYLLEHGRFDLPLLTTGISLMVIGNLLAFWRYQNQDILTT